MFVLWGSVCSRYKKSDIWSESKIVHHFVHVYNDADIYRKSFTQVDLGVTEFWYTSTLICWTMETTALKMFRYFQFVCNGPGDWLEMDCYYGTSLNVLQIPISLCYSLSLSLLIFLSIYHLLTLSLTLSLSHFLFHSLPVSLFIYLLISLFLSLSLNISLSIFIYLYISISISVMVVKCGPLPKSAL